MATSAGVDLKNLYRKYQSSIEDIVEKRYQDVHKLLQSSYNLTKKEQHSLSTSSKRAKGSQAADVLALKKILKDRLLKSDENFLAIIKVIKRK